MATLQSQEEMTFVIALVGDDPTEDNGAFIGLRRLADGMWGWCDGTGVTFTAWGGSNCSSGPYPNNAGIPGDVCGHVYIQNCGWIWDDTPAAWAVNYSNLKFVIEWSADCNGNDIVDFGEIRDGLLPDSNHNNIPDCCESAAACCPADLNEDGQVNGPDLGALVAFWGPNPSYGRADITGDGTVNGSDIAALLSAWGPCAN